MSDGLTSVHVSGALLPTDVLSSVLAGHFNGLTSSAYHLGGEAPREAAARVWTHLLGRLPPVPHRPGPAARR